MAKSDESKKQMALHLNYDGNVVGEMGALSTSVV